MPDDKKKLEDANRIVYFSGNFNEAMAKDTVTRLLEYEGQDPTKDILMIIDSYGGYVDSFIAIHDTMRLLRSPVATVCIGKAMSCGQMLLISGAKGKRFITPNSRVLVHQISSFSCGSLSQIENDFEETKRMQKEVLERLIKKYTKVTATKLKELMSKDSFLDAKQCLELGLVDKVVNSPNDLYKGLNI